MKVEFLPPASRYLHDAFSKMIEDMHHTAKTLHKKGRMNTDLNTVRSQSNRFKDVLLLKIHKKNRVEDIIWTSANFGQKNC